MIGHILCGRQKALARHCRVRNRRDQSWDCPRRRSANFRVRARPGPKPRAFCHLPQSLRSSPMRRENRGPKEMQQRDNLRVRCAPNLPMVPLRDRRRGRCCSSVRPCSVPRRVRDIHPIAQCDCTDVLLQCRQHFFAPFGLRCAWLLLPLHAQIPNVRSRRLSRRFPARFPRLFRVVFVRYEPRIRIVECGRHRANRGPRDWTLRANQPQFGLLRMLRPHIQKFRGQCAAIYRDLKSA